MRGPAFAGASFLPADAPDSTPGFCFACPARRITGTGGAAAAAATTALPAPAALPASSPSARCPICREGHIQEVWGRVHLGLEKVHEFRCERCGSVLVDRGGSPRAYQLTETKRPELPTWKSYAHKTLHEQEWARIRDGGVSDEEQREHDFAQILVDLQAGKVTFAPPPGDPPVFLKGGERLVYLLSGITLREPHSVSQGVYGGPSIRVAKGITIRTGAFQAQSHEELRDVDQGTLALTNKRLVFAGSTHSVATDLPKLVSIDAYSDGVAVRASNREKTQFYLGLDRHAYTFTVQGRQQTEPFSGLVLKYTIEGLLASPK